MSQSSVSRTRPADANEHSLFDNEHSVPYSSRQPSEVAPSDPIARPTHEPQQPFFKNNVDDQAPQQAPAPPAACAPRRPAAGAPLASQPHSAPPLDPSPARLDKADLARLSTALEPSKIQRWIEALIETFEDYSPEAASLLSLPFDEAQAALFHQPHLRPLDRWAARQAMNTMQVDKPYVQLLLNASTEAATAARKSGVQLLAYVRDRASICNGETARLRVKHFDATTYFTFDIDAATTHLRADELRNDFLSLPAERTAAPNALLRAILDKLPGSISAQAAILEDKLVEAEIINNAPPWTFDQLVHLAAQHILVAARRAAATPGSAQVHALEAKQSKKSDRGPRQEQAKCPCCGLQGHPPRECPTACKRCKQRSCPGNYGSSCVIVATSFPDTIINALGKPVPPNVKAILLKVREKRAATTSSQSANASSGRSANVLEANPLPDDNLHMWEIMNDDGRAAHALIATKEACPTIKRQQANAYASCHE